MMSMLISLKQNYLIFSKLGRVLQVHFLLSQRVVTGCQSQAAQGITASTPFLDHSHDLILNWTSQGHTGGANTHIGTSVNHTLRSALQQ